MEHDGNEPEKYRKDGIGNASHIGIYTGLSGGEMVSAATKAGVVNASDWDYGSGAMHSSSSRGHVCTSKFAGKSISGGWNRVGLWSALSYGDKIDAILQGSGGVGEVTIATVVAESGSTVNMRSRASTSGAVIRRISIGEHVTVNDHGAEWCEIMYQGDHGYMMTKFLSFEEDSNEITVKKDDVKKVYDILGECLKQVIVDKANVETAYDTIGDWLGLRG